MEHAPLLVHGRQKAAELLAGLGDPRYPVSIEQWQQQTRQLSTQFGRDGTHYWRYIPAGHYQVGGWKETEQATTIELQPYWVGRFMVTVDQYRAFMDDGGYTNNDYWTADGLAWKNRHGQTEPRYWEIQVDASYRNQPIYAVSWYEAMAYCRWLTQQLAPWLPPCHQVCLTSEAEWEVAAAYNGQGQRQPYPWGDRPITSEHAVYNFRKTVLPLSVGLELLGQATCGMLDSVGNLWEWTATTLHLNNINKKDVMKNHDWMIVRGGSYFSDSENVCCASYDWHRPIEQYYALGFRCVITDCSPGFNADFQVACPFSEKRPQH